MKNEDIDRLEALARALLPKGRFGDPKLVGEYIEMVSPTNILALIARVRKNEKTE